MKAEGGLANWECAFHALISERLAATSQFSLPGIYLMRYMPPPLGTRRSTLSGGDRLYLRWILYPPTPLQSLKRAAILQQRRISGLVACWLSVAHKIITRASVLLCPSRQGAAL